jgi:5S rRNA maturation endonuclease (ribonuclease M5)
LVPMSLEKERRFDAFKEFLGRFVGELNDASKEGAAVLVEGKRDVRALRLLGYSGELFAVADLSKPGMRSRLMEHDRVLILTDLDSEGRRLAAKCAKLLPAMGLKPSLAERRRLSAASRGVFLHIENLGRFAREDAPG